jgi:hypothetical protein
MEELIEMLRSLKVGDKVYGWGEKRPYKVYFNDGKYVVIAKKMFGETMHSIIDLENEIMGASDSWQWDIEDWDDDFETNFKKYVDKVNSRNIDVIGHSHLMKLSRVEVHQLRKGK